MHGPTPLCKDGVCGALTDELLLCSVSDASRPIREDVCFVFLDIAVPFTSGFGDWPEWHHLIALGWLVINLLLGCFQSRKLHNIGFALEVTFGQSGECFHVARSQSDVSRDGVQRHDLLFDQQIDGATKQTWLLWATVLVSGFRFRTPPSRATLRKASEHHLHPASQVP